MQRQGLQRVSGGLFPSHFFPAFFYFAVDQWALSRLLPAPLSPSWRT